MEFNNCKFGTYCMFGHDATEKRKVDKDIETLQKQLEEVKHDICKKENEMKQKDGEIKTLALNMEKKTASLENRIQSLEENLEQLRNENQMLRAQFMAQVTNVEEIDSEAQEKIDTEVRLIVKPKKR